MASVEYLAEGANIVPLIVLNLRGVKGSVTSIAADSIDARNNFRATFGSEVVESSLVTGYRRVV
jgi:hypothetical protein